MAAGTSLLQLPREVMLHICLRLPAAADVRSLLSTCRTLHPLLGDAQLMADWLLAHQQPRALLHTCGFGHGPAAARLLSSCDSPLKPKHGTAHGLTPGLTSQPASPTAYYVSGQDAEAALVAAVERGHVDVVAMLLRWGVPAAGLSNNGQPLVAAATSGQFQAAQVLLEAMGHRRTSAEGAGSRPQQARRRLFHASADADASRGPRMMAALMAAAAAGRTAMLRLLTQHSDGVPQDNVLTAAAQAGHVEAVEVLCEMGQFADCTCTHHALAAAARAGHLPVVRWLWQHVSLKDASSQGALVPAVISAAAGGHADILQLLLGCGGRGLDQDALDAAFLAASEAGHATAARALLEAGADVDAQDCMALGYACQAGDTCLARTLMDAGSGLPPNAPHLLATVAGLANVELMRLLLHAGVNPHAMDEAALRCAASQGAADVVSELLGAPWHADVHANDDEALLWAVDNGHEDVVRLLLAAGAHAAGTAGAQLLWCAIQRGPAWHGVVHALMDAGASLLAAPHA